MKRILVTSKTYGQKYIKVDDVDFPLVSKHLWCIAKGRNTFYAVTSIIKNGKRKTVTMHRMISGVDQKGVVDHRDHDGLNNRRSNLRNCSNRENLQNRSRTSNGYKGVYTVSMFLAVILINGKQKRLGVYQTAEQAAKAYNRAAKKQHGEHAILNKL